jgi:5-methylcytosine-specific restriction endonuclease McrA
MEGYIKFNRIFQCKHCGCKIPESHPHICKDGTYYCWDCSFLTKQIDEKEYLKYCGNCLNNAHVGVIDGKVVVYVGKHPPWIKRTDKEERHGIKYRLWRNSVFERDGYTCQDCGQKGGGLNAHHIKSFKKYPKLRYEINNGITLCEKCHRKRHRKKVSA